MLQVRGYFRISWNAVHLECIVKLLKCECIFFFFFFFRFRVFYLFTFLGLNCRRNSGIMLCFILCTTEIFPSFFLYAGVRHAESVLENFACK